MSIIVQIQHCQNCHLHSWCSRHDQSKYQEHCHKVKQYAIKIFQNCQFKQNQPSTTYQPLKEKGSKGQTKYLDNKNDQIVHFPRFGSFEISVNGILIFSKLKSNLWPKHDRISQLFQKIKQKTNTSENIQKFSLEYRLKNQNDQYFRDTYKKIIQKNQTLKKRPLSQNHSQANYALPNHSPSNFKKNNQNFISRKLHQSLKKGVNGSEMYEKYDFIKAYQSRTGSSKQPKRPLTNHFSRNQPKQIGIEHNENRSDYFGEFDQANHIQNNNSVTIKKAEREENKLKLSQGPRKRLQIFREAVTKPIEMKNSPFNKQKQYLNLNFNKNVLKKQSNEIASSKSHHSNNNNISSQQNVIPVVEKNKLKLNQNNKNSFENKPQKMFKRLVISNRLKDTEQIKQKNIVKKVNEDLKVQLQDNQKQEDLIAKLQKQQEEESFKKVNNKKNSERDINHNKHKVQDKGQRKQESINQIQKVQNSSNYVLMPVYCVNNNEKQDLNLKEQKVEQIQKKQQLYEEQYQNDKFNKKQSQVQESYEQKNQIQHDRKLLQQKQKQQQQQYQQEYIESHKQDAVQEQQIYEDDNNYEQQQQRKKSTSLDQSYTKNNINNNDTIDHVRESQIKRQNINQQNYVDEESKKSGLIEGWTKNQLSNQQSQRMNVKEQSEYQKYQKNQSKVNQDQKYQQDIFQDNKIQQLNELPKKSQLIDQSQKIIKNNHEDDKQTIKIQQKQKQQNLKNVQEMQNKSQKYEEQVYQEQEQIETKLKNIQDQQNIQVNQNVDMQQQLIEKVQENEKEQINIETKNQQQFKKVENIQKISENDVKQSQKESQKFITIKTKKQFVTKQNIQKDELVKIQQIQTTININEDQRNEGNIQKTSLKQIQQNKQKNEIIDKEDEIIEMQIKQVSNTQLKQNTAHYKQYQIIEKKLQQNQYEPEQQLQIKENKTPQQRKKVVIIQSYQHKDSSPQIIHQIQNKNSNRNQQPTSQQSPSDEYLNHAHFLSDVNVSHNNRSEQYQSTYNSNLHSNVNNGADTINYINTGTQYTVNQTNKQISATSIYKYIKPQDQQEYMKLENQIKQEEYQQSNQFQEGKQNKDKKTKGDLIEIKEKSQKLMDINVNEEYLGQEDNQQQSLKENYGQQQLQQIKQGKMSQENKSIKQIGQSQVKQFEQFKLVEENKQNQNEQIKQIEELQKVQQIQFQSKQSKQKIQDIQQKQKIQQNKKQQTESQKVEVNEEQDIKNNNKDQQINKKDQQIIQNESQSHHSIPIIVSTYEGTNRIIQDQISKELSQIYAKQQIYKQQRQQILIKIGQECHLKAQQINQNQISSEEIKYNQPQIQQISQKKMQIQQINQNIEKKTQKVLDNEQNYKISLNQNQNEKQNEKQNVQQKNLTINHQIQKQSINIQVKNEQDKKQDKQFISLNTFQHEDTHKLIHQYTQDLTQKINQQQQTDNNLDKYDDIIHQEQGKQSKHQIANQQKNQQNDKDEDDKDDKDNNEITENKQNEDNVIAYKRQNTFEMIGEYTQNLAQKASQIQDDKLIEQKKQQHVRKVNIDQIQINQQLNNVDDKKDEINQTNINKNEIKQDNVNVQENTQKFIASQTEQLSQRINQKEGQVQLESKQIRQQNQVNHKKKNIEGQIKQSWEIKISEIQENKKKEEVHKQNIQQAYKVEEENKNQIKIEKQSKSIQQIKQVYLNNQTHNQPIQLIKQSNHQIQNIKSQSKKDIQEFNEEKSQVNETVKEHVKSIQDKYIYQGQDQKLKQKEKYELKQEKDKKLIVSQSHPEHDQEIQQSVKGNQSNQIQSSKQIVNEDKNDEAKQQDQRKVSNNSIQSHTELISLNTQDIIKEQFSELTEKIVENQNEKVIMN